MFFSRAVKFYHYLGIYLYQIRYLCVLLMLIGISVSIWLVFSSPQVSEKYLQPSLLINTWLLLTVSLAYFRADVFFIDRSQLGLFKKLFSAIRIAFASLLIISFSLLCIILLWMSVSALSRILFA